jgi:predicted transcriptional regulator
MKNFEKIQEVLSEAQEDVRKFLNGNKTAGTRLRKAMQEIKSLAQNVRADVQQMKNND